MHEAARDQVAIGVHYVRLYIVGDRFGHVRWGLGGGGTHQRSACLFEIVNGETGHDATHARRQGRHQGHATRHLGQIHQRHRVHGGEVIPHRLAVAQLNPGIAGTDIGVHAPHRAGVRRGAPHGPAEEAFAEGETGETFPVAQEEATG